MAQQQGFYKAAGLKSLFYRQILRTQIPLVKCWLAKLNIMREQDAFNRTQDGFIYQYIKPEQIKISWMLITAIIISLLSIPLYLRLMFRKSV